MTQVVDRRTDKSKKNKGAGIRRRFLERNKPHVKRAIDKAIGEGEFKDMGKGGIDVTVPKDDLREPTIHHGQGGTVRRVNPGNKEFVKGDRIPRPQGGGGGGGGGQPGDGDASDSGFGEDEFVFQLSEEEFLEHVFADLELPNMTKVTVADTTKTKMKYAGIVTDGPQNKLHLLRSKKQKMGRLIAAESKYNKKIIELLKEEKDILSSYDEEGSFDNEQENAETGWKPKKKIVEELTEDVTSLKDAFMAVASDADVARIAELDEEIEELAGKKKRVPRWNQSTDLRYTFHAPKPTPSSKAVMFCLMDVSGSMDQETKNQAKLFYFLLHRFLERHYEKIDLVFVRHTTEAKEVDEQEFFYGRETGGTMVSSALELMEDIISKRYPPDEWNIYGAQASDGDNWGDDNKKSVDLLKNNILGNVQGYFYTEIVKSYARGGPGRALWRAYEEGVAKEFSDRFWMGKINERKDIYPVFRDFFKKKGEGASSMQAALQAPKP
jgi:uncharacterized sporulation protein YeaH/YhbH (DUF444 family)